MRAVILNCTLKPSPESPSTETLAKAIIPETYPVPEGGE